MSPDWPIELLDRDGLGDQVVRSHICYSPEAAFDAEPWHDDFDTNSIILIRIYQRGWKRNSHSPFEARDQSGQPTAS